MLELHRGERFCQFSSYWNVRGLTRLVSLFMLCAFVGFAAAADDFDSKQLQSRLQAAVQKALPAVVGVTQQNRSGQITGSFSGVIISSDGYILSAAHAVAPNVKYDVYLTDGRKVTATGLGSNRDLDCAMMKIDPEGTWPYAEMGKSADLKVNQPVFGISYPGLYSPKRAPVIRFGRVVKTLTSTSGMFQTTASMEPGDSGGPLLDLEGRVIGIHSQIDREMEKNFEVPIDSFRLHWDKLKEPNVFFVDQIPGLLSPGFRPVRFNFNGRRGNGPRGGPGPNAPERGTPPAQGAPPAGDRTPREPAPQEAPVPLDMPKAGQPPEDVPDQPAPVAPPSSSSGENTNPGTGAPNASDNESPAPTPPANNPPTPPNDNQRGIRGRGNPGGGRFGRGGGGRGRGGPIVVDQVIEGSAAERAGIKPGDRILQIDGSVVPSFQAMRTYIERRGFEGERVFDLTVRPENQDLEKHVILKFPEPEVKDDDASATSSGPFDKIPDLVKTFADMETYLDDLTVVVYSERGNESMFILATRLKQPNYLISKNSFVFQNPTIQLNNGKIIPAEVVARDEENDLVLIRATLPAGPGIDLNESTGDMVREQMGSLLISPSPDGDGFVSILGSPPFSSARTDNRGYLGIELEQYEKNVYISSMRNGGAAMRAGLRPGDKLLKLDKKDVVEVQQFIDTLKTKEVGQVVTLTYERNGREYTKDITLATLSAHVAEEFEGGKSRRRDGYSQVLVHDASLLPSDCGGPIFDIDGHFIGMNIARYSRTQSYAIPRSVIKAFVDKALPK